MWIISQQRLARLRWSRLTPAQRRLQLEPVWAARRAAKNKRLLAAINPRIRKLVGDANLLRQMGRTPC